MKLITDKSVGMQNIMLNLSIVLPTLLKVLLIIMIVYKFCCKIEDCPLAHYFRQLFAVCITPPPNVHYKTILQEP